MAKSAFKPATFISTSKYLSLPLPAIKSVRTVEGKDVIVNVTPGEIAFKDHRFVAKTKEHVEFLREHRANGTLFSELPDAPQEKPKPAGALEVEQIEGVQSKNEALAFLVKEKGVSPSELKDKTAAEIVEFALKSYSCAFPNWEFAPSDNKDEE